MSGGRATRTTYPAARELVPDQPAVPGPAPSGRSADVFSEATLRNMHISRTVADVFSVLALTGDDTSPIPPKDIPLLYGATRYDAAVVRACVELIEPAFADRIYISDGGDLMLRRAPAE